LAIRARTDDEVEHQLGDLSFTMRAVNQSGNSAAIREQETLQAHRIP
jgi:hypothetical protein